MIISNGSILLPLAQFTTGLVQVPAQVRDFTVYYTRSPASECGEGVCLNFYPLDGSPVNRFVVFRSSVGFEASVAGLVDLQGKTLSLSVNMGPTQEVVFDGVTPVVDQLNAITGAYAVVSAVYPQKILVRILGGTAPGMIQIFGGSALADLGLTPRTITLNSHDTPIVEIPRVPGDIQDGIEYCDPDGTLWDTYSIASVDNFDEISFKTGYQSPQQTTGRVCYVFGYVTDPSGVRIPDVEVVAKVLDRPQTVVTPTYIDTTAEVKAYSDYKGYFEISLLQGALVEFKMESISMYRILRIPDVARVALSDVYVDREYQIPAGGR